MIEPHLHRKALKALHQLLIEGRMLAHKEENDRLFDFFDAIELFPGLMLTSGDMTENFGDFLEGYTDQYNCGYIYENYIKKQVRVVADPEESPLIWCLDLGKRAESDALSKGYRSDVYVQVGTDFFQVEIYDPIRIAQDLEAEMKINGVYTSEPNMIVVKKVSTPLIKKTIHHLWQRRYFEALKPLAAEVAEGLDFLPF